MSKAQSDPDPRTNAQKVTNADDQEVVVNHSTVEEGGYDEPANQQVEAPKPEEKQPKKDEPAAEESRPNTNKPQPGAPRKRPYDEEEAE
jgi:hypothetical protein